MKKHHLFEYRMFSVIYDTQQSKDDIIYVILVSTFIFFERYCAIVLSCQVVIRQQIKEKQRGTIYISEIPQSE